MLLASELGTKIAMIDAEPGRGDLYSDMFDYDIHQLNFVDQVLSSQVASQQTVNSAGFH